MMVDNIKSVLVIGMARSGVAAAKLLKKLNKKVYVYDSKKIEDIPLISNEILSTWDGVFLGTEPMEMIEKKEFDLVVISPGVPLYIELVKNIKKAGIPIIGELELGYRYAEGSLIAITGTNGKTTTTSLVGHIVQCANRNYEVVGNIGVPITERIYELIDASLEYNVGRLWIAEVSSFQLESIDKFHPKISSILNITPDHLNRHGSMEEYINAKKRIYENQDKDDVLILNADDAILKKLGEQIKEDSLNIMYFGIKECGENCVYLKDNVIMIYPDIPIIHVDEMNIIGQHNVSNAMAAVAMCHRIGIRKEDIIEGLRTFQAVDHRLQKILEYKGIQFYNDSKATNSDASIVALQSMKNPVILIAGGMDKKNDFTEFIQYVKLGVKQMIVFGETADILRQTAIRENYKDVLVVNNMKEAVEKAYEIAISGDIVLLSPACASWDMYKNFEVRGRDFIKCVYDVTGVGEGK